MIEAVTPFSFPSDSHSGGSSGKLLGPLPNSTPHIPDFAGGHLVPAPPVSDPKCYRPGSPSEIDPALSEILQNLVTRPVHDARGKCFGKISAVWENSRGVAVFLAVRGPSLRGKDFLLPACLAEVNGVGSIIRLSVASEWVETGPSILPGWEFTEEMKLLTWNYYHLKEGHRFDPGFRDAGSMEHWRPIAGECANPQQAICGFEWSFLVKFAAARGDLESGPGIP